MIFSKNIQLATLTSVIFVGAIAFAAVGRSLGQPLGRQQETTKLEELKRASQYRNNWLVGHWPPPDTSVTINSLFGRYIIPLQNLGGRNEFVLQPLNHSALSVPRPDGSFDWASFSLSFWMPDGAGVLTNAPRLLTYEYVDPVDLKWHRAPMRPREVGRPDPSPTRYTVVVGEFCPGVVPRPLSRVQGSSLAFEGYGYGTLSMWGCAANKPNPEWTSIEVHGPGNTEMYCHTNADICFGWIDLVDEGVRALTYVPRDAVAQIPKVAARIHELLQSWKTPD